MAKKTKFKIDVTFDDNVPLSYVESAKLQKEKGGQKTKKTLGATKPSVSITDPVLHWDEETDPIAKSVKLAIKEVHCEVTFSARIWVDKQIDKKTSCYAHVIEHENEHVKIWKDGAKKYSKDIVKAVTDATKPSMSSPEDVKSKDLKKFRKAAFERIEAALHAAVKKYGGKISKESKKIHTSAELAKTNSLCEDYLRE